MDEFWFSILPDKIIGPFDFISVENICNTVTIGIVKELRTIRGTDVTISNQYSRHNYSLRIIQIIPRITLISRARIAKSSTVMT